MRKVDIGRQGFRDILVLEELQSVVLADGVNLILRSIICSDFTLVPFTYNRIAVPVADSGLLNDNRLSFHIFLLYFILKISPFEQPRFFLNIRNKIFQ
jgi:hypothetical protein